MDLRTILQNAQSPDLALRSHAESQLDQALEQQYDEFLLALCGELVTEGNSEANRQLAGLYMKNLITAQDETLLREKTQKWFNCSPAIKEQFKNGLLQVLLSPVRVVYHTGAQVVAAFGAVDISSNQWPQLLPTLFQNVSSLDSPIYAKISSLETLGYLCEEMDPNSVEKEVVDVILNTIVGGMRADREDEIRKAAVTALCNSLDFTEKNFEIEEERNAIMQVVCEATQCRDITVRVKAFECIATIAELYYSKLQHYMDVIFGLTSSAMKTDDQLVGQKAIEFWSTVCDTESDMVDILKQGGEPEDPYLRIAEQAAGQLVPLLLETLTKQEEDITDDSWNISMAAATCLESLAAAIEDNIVDLVIPFISAHISSPEWRLKEASIMAFSCIMDGPSGEKLTPIVASALPIILECFRDQSPHIRDTATWTVARICQFHTAALSIDLIPTLMNGLVAALEDEHTQVASQGCNAIFRFAEACSDSSENDTNLLSQYLSVLLQKLLDATNRDDWELHNLRSSAYEAINMLVEASAKDMEPTIRLVYEEALNRLEQTFASHTDHQERMQSQSMCCSLIGQCIQKLPTNQVIPLADRTMTLTLQVFTTKGAVAHEDAFMMVGYLADNLEGDFARYLQHFMPALMTGLRNVEEYQVCACAVGVVGDLCRALNREIVVHCDDIVRALLELLQSASLTRIVKPQVLAVFADIAMAIEADFQRYSGVVLSMLQQAGEVSITTNDEEVIEYINSLREAILEAYSGIIQGLKAENKLDVLLPFLEKILDFAARCGTDSVIPDRRSGGVVKALVALFGDLGIFAGQYAIPLLSQPFVDRLIVECSEDEDTADIAEYTREVVAKIQGR